MSWLSSFLVAVLTAALTAVAAGLVAAGCVEWYKISSREGESSYFIFGIGLLGGFAGFLAGLILSRFSSGFVTGLGISAGSMLGLSGLVALIAWMLADIPPTIKGHQLDLVVEIRLPKGAEQPPIIDGKQFILFESGDAGEAGRKHEQGFIEMAKAKQVDGRWVVPGSVLIFTARRKRFLTVILDEKEGFGFQLPLPGHPGTEYEQWSEWQPPGTAAKPWPETRMSYRFRVRERIPVEAPSPPDKFASLAPDSPLEEWLSFFDSFGRIPERRQAILKVAEGRPADLAKLVGSRDYERYGPAMDVVSQMQVVDPAVLQALREVAADIEDQIRKFNTMSPEQEGYDDLGNQIRTRFNRWCAPWESVHRESAADARPPVEAIMELATVHRESLRMEEVANDARYALRNYFPVPAERPK